MDQRNHFFFAVRIPKKTKLIMKDHMEKIKEVIPFSRWVYHEDLHITLAFLGDAPIEKLEAAKNYVKDAIYGSKSIKLNINRLGFFGNENSPRVFWADTEESELLKLIQKKVFSACGKAGFQLETRSFRPHITLARKWAGITPFQKEMLGLWNELQSDPLQFEAEDVVLYQTHLNKIPKYEAITIFPLSNEKT